MLTTPCSVTSDNGFLRVQYEHCQQLSIAMTQKSLELAGSQWYNGTSRMFYKLEIELFLAFCPLQHHD